MALTSILAVYFVIWWVTLFAVLPLGVRTQAEEGEVVPGSNPSAPVQPHMLKKALLTSVIAAILTAAVLAIVEAGWLDFSLDPTSGR